MSYSTVRERVFIPKCISCHGNSGGCNLETYESARARASDIERKALIERSMPPNGPLTSIEARILDKWIKDGAPNGEGPPPEVLKPNYESIKKNLFALKCLRCHSQGGAAERVPLDDYKKILDSPREIVIPGNPEESGIIIAVTRTDDKRMPPPDVSDALSIDQIKVLNEWILKGAPEKE